MFTQGKALRLWRARPRAMTVLLDRLLNTMCGGATQASTRATSPQANAVDGARGPAVAGTEEIQRFVVEGQLPVRIYVGLLAIDENGNRSAVSTSSQSAPRMTVTRFSTPRSPI